MKEREIQLTIKEMDLLYRIYAVFGFKSDAIEKQLQSYVLIAEQDITTKDCIITVTEEDRPAFLRRISNVKNFDYFDDQEIDDLIKKLNTAFEKPIEDGKLIYDKIKGAANCRPYCIV